MKKVKIVVDEVEGTPQTLINNEEQIVIIYEGVEIPMELHDWIIEHVGNRPDDRG